MASWEETKAGAQKVFTSAINDISSTYQQILISGHAYPNQEQREQPTVNPEYMQMQRAYAAQEQEREQWQGITEASYQPTNIDWEEYGRYLDDYEAAQPQRGYADIPLTELSATEQRAFDNWSASIPEINSYEPER